MPELPDLVLYLEALGTRILGEHLTGFRLLSPFVLRSVDPSIDSIHGLSPLNLLRVGKRIVLAFEQDFFCCSI